MSVSARLVSFGFSTFAALFFARTSLNMSFKVNALIRETGNSAAQSRIYTQLAYSSAVEAVDEAGDLTASQRKTLKAMVKAELEARSRRLK